nr:immunoglobulin light chain junction region [Macaca mulatta]MOY17864.1 immunoglobulin light chain junction region [Macaca mulatta]
DYYCCSYTTSNNVFF